MAEAAYSAGELALSRQALRNEEHLIYAEICRRLGVSFTTVKSWTSGNGRRRAAA
jgi:DNA-binding transcriptional regulator YiaG